MSLALTITGALKGARALRGEYLKLYADLSEIQRITRDKSITEEQKVDLIDAIRLPSSNWTDIKYMRENVRLFVIAQAWDNLKLPTALVLTGAVLGAAGDVVGALA